jgi:carbonic anhydrase/acetyltransferase-like protein (isoleucine patch superfamily)
VLSNGVRITGAGTVELEGDNWVGTGATLVAPVTLRRGAVVAPGTVVSGVVPAMAIAAGNPGQVIGSRFSNDVIRQHEAARLPVGRSPEHERGSQQRPRLPSNWGKSRLCPSCNPFSPVASPH